jgi:hypothetical protein
MNSATGAQTETPTVLSGVEELMKREVKPGSPGSLSE